jgi:hypothetical protein
MKHYYTISSYIFKLILDKVERLSADLTDLGAQFTDPVGFSQMAAERSVVSF